ncbi:MAG: ParB/RepB/Spo0J family partition protein [Alistipes sp.]|nr:ParB/RepB/Spo0J family partition protein [Alistipes sp.]
MKKGLGRGLSGIIPLNTTEVAEKAMREIKVAEIVPNPTQPRTDFNEESLAELAESIRTLGLIQPITVKPEGDKFMIISGERRWRAAQRAGIESLPAYIRKTDDTTLHAMALVENIQREDLNPLEIALGLRRLIEECGVTQEALAEKVGMSRPAVANHLRLLRLSAPIQAALKEGAITMGHAKALLAVESESKQVSLLRRTLKSALSVRQLEDTVRALSERKTKASNSTEEEYPESYSRLIEELERFFSQNISIKRGKSGGGKIVIDFASDEDVEQFLRKFAKHK